MMKNLKILMLSVVLIAGMTFALNAQGKPSVPSSKEALVTFKVNIHCDGCKSNLEKHVLLEKGVKAIKANTRSQTVQIAYDSSITTEETLQKAIEKLGFKTRKITLLEK